MYLNWKWKVIYWKSAGDSALETDLEQVHEISGAISGRSSNKLEIFITMSKSQQSNSSTQSAVGKDRMPSARSIPREALLDVLLKKAKE